MIDRRQLILGAGALATLAATKASFAKDEILTLRGTFAKAGPDGGLASSLADLDALPQTRFSTTTPWQEGSVEFSGVALKDYFAMMGAAPEKIRLVALNDYVVDADVADLVAGDALLATRQNQVPMTIRDKGPIFLIFPFDSRSDLQHQTYYSRSVWQLTEIDILA